MKEFLGMARQLIFMVAEMESTTVLLVIDIDRHGRACIDTRTFNPALRSVLEVYGESCSGRHLFASLVTVTYCGW